MNENRRNGGKEQSRTKVNGTDVAYYVYESTRYALWEKDGFTYSLTGGDGLEGDVATLLG